MVVREREVVHRPHHDLAVLDHGALLGGVHAEDGRLGQVDDRRRQHQANTPPFEIENVPPVKLLDRELAVLRALAELADLLLDLGEALRSASLRIGTTSPRGLPSATPMSK